MKESRINELSKELESLKKGLDGFTKLMPELLKDSLSKMNDEEKSAVELFGKEANTLSNNDSLSVPEKMLMLQELRKKYGTSNNKK